METEVKKGEAAAMQEELVNSICENVGTPFYAYDYENIRKNFAELKNSLPDNANLCYSIKANPSFAICQIISGLTSKAEASSLGEMYCALNAGFKSENIVLSGPGKTLECIAFALREGIGISVESIEEVQLISELCNALNQYADIIIRINPNFSSKRSGISMCGLPSQFGIDYTELESAVSVIRQLQRVNLAGLSIYLSSQILDAETIIENTHSMLKVFICFQEKYHIKVNLLDFGGGFGISYYNDICLDLKVLKNGLSKLFKEYENEIADKQIIFESGRYIMAESGSFFTKILYKKKSGNKNYLICDGGFNNVLISAFFTREIRGNFPIDVVSKKIRLADDNPKEYCICGPLCSPRDILGSKVLLPSVDTGDILEIKKVGAYGFTYSPLFFLSNDIPAEVIIKGDRYYVIRKRMRGVNLLDDQAGLPEELFI